MIQRMLAIWSLVPLPFLKPVCISGSSQFTYCWRLAWRILSITSVWDECNCSVVWTFFGIEMETDLFQSCGHCWVYGEPLVFLFVLWTSEPREPACREDTGTNTEKEAERSEETWPRILMASWLWYQAFPEAWLPSVLWIPSNTSVSWDKFHHF